MSPCALCGEREAAPRKGGRCERCAKWLQRNPGRPPPLDRRPYGQSHRKRLVNAALGLGESDSEDDERFRRAESLLLKYAQQKAKVRLADVVEHVARLVVDIMIARDNREPKMSRSQSNIAGASTGTRSNGRGRER